MKKNAFTLIELVFSIVAVGIVILSIPLIIKQSNANTIQSQNVLGFYNALTLMETIKNKPWDTNNLNDFNISGEYYILETNGGYNCALDKSIIPPGQGGNPNNPQGTPTAQIYTKKGLGNANRRRMCDPDRKQATDNNYNDSLSSINHFNNHKLEIKSNGNTIFRLETKINYARVNFGTNQVAGSLTPTNNTDDVKEITISLFRMPTQLNAQGVEEPVAVYKYYAANIGTDIPFIKDNG